MNEQSKQLIKKYVDVFLKRKTLIFTMFLLGVLGGLTVYATTPRTYEAFALLIYEQQKVNPAKMSPDLRAKTREILSTITQQVTSRNSLEQIIQDMNLYVEERKKIPLEDVIEIMRKQVRINPTKGDVFEVGYIGPDPRKVLRVTNTLASKFIEENLKYREERATVTSNYIRDELELAKLSLDKKEQSMRDYKLQYYNEMPQQRELNVARLDTLQVKLQGVQDNIQELERTKILVQEQIGARKRLLNNYSTNALPENEQSKSRETLDPYQQLAQLRSYLHSLTVKYKESHPEVKRVRAKIASMEKLLGASAVDGSSPSSSSFQVQDPVLQQAEIQKRDIDLNINALRKDEAALRTQIERLEDWIAAAPTREAEWNSLTRDYDELKRHYDYLVAQNLQAESVQNLEQKQQGSQFKIFDPPRLPEKPIKPNFLKIMILAVGLGLAFGGGTALGLDLIDSSFKDPVSIEEYLGLSVTCSIPDVKLPREKHQNRVRLIAFYIYVVSGVCVIVGAIWFLWSKGKLII
ncbi:GumC family protein [Desulfogranum japonicum]|uniref:GumC family protein n=1 Tax=Desulfogranum japonicum TaxID=231447 RepID=UPI00040C0B4F|nr:hypothetical protein [Desulfogranum japonicum]